MRGEKPVLLVEADATDPSATGNAIAALQGAVRTSLAHDLRGPLARLNRRTTRWTCASTAATTRRASPPTTSCPGLLGTILTMTMILMTGLAMTRERERGTFENLLATPALPIEVMTGKIVPYILIGLVQVTLLLLAALLLFDVPLAGSVALLYLAVLVFIAANLALGITFSSMARNQLQAMQMTFFFFLPSILLSGFMFPFRGMPVWAQWIGNVLPLTHFLRLVRGIMLKGSGLVRAVARGVAHPGLPRGGHRRGARGVPQDPRLALQPRPEPQGRHRQAPPQEASDPALARGHRFAPAGHAIPGRPHREQRLVQRQPRIALDAFPIGAQRFQRLLEMAAVLRVADVADAIGRRIVLVIEPGLEVAFAAMRVRPMSVFALGIGSAEDGHRLVRAGVIELLCRGRHRCLLGF